MSFWTETLARRLNILGLTFFLIALTYQVYYWKHYSLEASLLQVQSWFTYNDIEDNLELGSICNTLENFECSKKYFLKVVNEDPTHKQALANLGIANGHLGDWQSCRLHLEAYFSNGGNGYDAMYWYGKALSQLEGPEIGIGWQYYALMLNPEYKEAALGLIKELKGLKRWEEALSVAAAFTKGQPHLEREWSQVVDDLKKHITNGDRALASIRFPAIMSELFFAPVRLKNKGRLHFFLIEPTQNKILINAGVLEENLLSVPEQAKTIKVSNVKGSPKGYKMTLDKLIVGPWTFESIDVVVCKSCPSTLGKDFLRKVNWEEWSKHKTKFLTMSRKERSR